MRPSFQLVCSIGLTRWIVGGALRNNPFAPVVPCHRVVASTLFIGGFQGEWASAKVMEQKPAGKIGTKLALLESEGVRFTLEGFLVGGHAAVWGGE